MRGVDKSVVLMKPEDELTESKFKNLVTTQRTYIRSDSLDYNHCRKQPQEQNSDEMFAMPPDYGWWWHSYPEKKKDIQNIIQDMGLLVQSTWSINAPITCKKQNIMPRMKMAAPEFGSSPMEEEEPGMAPPAMPAAPGIMEVVNFDDVDFEAESAVNSGASEPRTFFPETLLWSLQPVPASGSCEVPVTVPDTITEWRAQMFCVGDGGLGLSDSAKMTVFQPFFMDLMLPSSVQRAETLELKASVFNYMSDQMMIKTSLAESDQYIMGSSKDITFCLGGGQKKTISWQMTPSALGLVNISVISEAVKGQCGGQDTVVPEKGSRDAIIQPLLVKPEGTLVEQAHNNMLIVEEGKTVSEKINLVLPKSYVVGSERGFVSFSGDVLGSAFNNLDSLLTMSYGCGEQNMLKFAPNVYVLRYLKSSGQLTDAILEKGKKFLDEGQQRQLTYKHSDGSYSAFGKSDPEGSTWLTAFVIKSFCQARDFCFIDGEHIKQGLSFLEKQQKDDGCFKATGRVLHNGMKGGVDDEVSLTAYVLVALLECGRELNDPVVKKALQCLKKEPAEKATPYKLALKAYAYTLANSSAERADIMQILDKKANKEDGMLYWSQEPKVEKESYWSKPSSVEVELTGYVHLAKSSYPGLTSKDIGDMVAITRWMCKQQNGNGGFSSTQDTVVGLHSLAAFATITSGKSGEVVLDVTSVKGFKTRLLINNDNKLLLQRVTLPEVPGEFLVTASGVGTVFMQVVQRYHSPPEVKKAAFAMSVNSQCLDNERMAVLMEYWYKGHRSNTNMAIIEFMPLSGYICEDGSMENLKKDSDVKRVEIKDGVINIYLEKVTTEHQTLEIIFKRSVKVTGLKPAFVRIFDYYMPEERNTVCYLNECQ
ncbi:alpha-2-macroglobulin-like protein 1 [Pyxicephalus adspersus]|uniref:alpha-2-macroglobulin-like protein 1 n=1 Tax=Pyxicephalus adspersus TaxID=30357 RepID=UPI003B5C18FD